VLETQIETQIETQMRFQCLRHKTRIHAEKE